MCQPTAPELLWNTHKLVLCENLLYNAQQLSPFQAIILNDIIENKALIQIEHYLQSNETSLKNFPHMPIPSTQNIYLNSTGKHFSIISYWLISDYIVILQ